MNVKIDIDLVENILRAYARRNREQLRIYGIVLGTVDKSEAYNLKTCIYGFLVEDKLNEENRESKIPVYINLFKPSSNV